MDEVYREFLYFSIRGFNFKLLNTYNANTSTLMYENIN